VATLAFDSRRYVGAQIGIHNPEGRKVGKVSHLRNLEYVVCAGERGLVDRITDKGEDLWKLPATSRS
jgi:adenine-specific DNA-methyltransferase